MPVVHPSYEQTGAKVRSLREALGQSQQTLATNAGIALRTLVRIEQGEDTKVGTLGLVAIALGTTTADLLAVPVPASPPEESEA